MRYYASSRISRVRVMRMIDDISTSPAMLRSMSSSPHNAECEALYRRYKNAKYELDLHIAIQLNIRQREGRLSILDAEAPDLESPGMRKLVADVTRARESWQRCVRDRQGYGRDKEDA